MISNKSTINNKNLFKRFKIGVKKGWNTPTLPENLLKLQLHPIIRVFRFVGGLSVLLILSKKLLYFPYPYVVYSLTLLISIFYLIYILCLTYYRFKHIYFLFKNNKLDVRNSPLDKFATICTKLIICLKGSCDTIAPAGVILGVMGGIDGLRECKGLEPIFFPFIANLFISDSPEQLQYKERKSLFRELNSTNKTYSALLEEKKNYI